VSIIKSQRLDGRAGWEESFIDIGGDHSAEVAVDPPKSREP
jgi:hypothetical protein